jgi:hypothetical protein
MEFVPCAVGERCCENSGSESNRVIEAESSVIHQRVVVSLAHTPALLSANVITRAFMKSSVHLCGAISNRLEVMLPT